MTDSDDPIDIEIVATGNLPGFPRPVDPKLLPHSLKTREMLVRAGKLPSIPPDWKPGTFVPLPPGWKYGDPIPPDWPPTAKDTPAERAPEGN